jgi:hypothetical protein
MGFLLWTLANTVLVESRRERLDQTEPITAVSVGLAAEGFLLAAVGAKSSDYSDYGVSGKTPTGRQ